MVDGPKDLLEGVLEVLPASVAGGVVFDKRDLPWTGTPSFEEGEGPGDHLLIAVEFGSAQCGDVILAVGEEFKGVFSVPIEFLGRVDLYVVVRHGWRCG